MNPIEIVLSVGLGITLLSLIIIIIVYMVSSRKANDNSTEQAIANLQSQLATFANTFDNRLSSVDQNMFTTLSRTQGTISELSERIGEMRESSRRLEDIGRDVSSLQDLLKPPKSRGAVGETILENILATMLPAHLYKLQYPLGNNYVDAVVVVGDRLVPIDAKFPLEDYYRVVNAETDEEREKERKKLVKNLKGKADDIASKYIRPKLGTYEFALMYIPAEAVYYEAIVSGDVFDYAGASRVIPVSPGTFYLYLQTIIIGLRGLQVEKEAQQILSHLKQLETDLGGFRGDYELLGKHLRNASSKFDDGARKLDKFDDQLSAIDSNEPDKLEGGV